MLSYDHLLKDLPKTSGLFILLIPLNSNTYYILEGGVVFEYSKNIRLYPGQFQRPEPGQAD